jgi:hypothetical protein
MISRNLFRVAAARTRMLAALFATRLGALFPAFAQSSGLSHPRTQGIAYSKPTPNSMTP